MRDAVDFMTAPDTALLEQLGLDALPYTGNARPSALWFATMKSRGLTVRTMIQETIGTRSQEGEQAGIYDCQFAESRAREVNPDTLSIAVVVSDGSWSDTWDCSAYGRGWASVATLRFFPYGATECCTSFIRGARGVNGLVLDGEWIPETWGTGRLMTQVVGPSPVPDSDLNHVHADYTGGATEEGGLSMADIDTIGQWLKDVEGRINAHVDKTISDGLWTWVTQNGDPLLRDIQAKIAALQAEVAALKAGAGGVDTPTEYTITGTAKPA